MKSYFSSWPFQSMSITSSLRLYDQLHRVLFSTSSLMTRQFALSYFFKCINCDSHQLSQGHLPEEKTTLILQLLSRSQSNHDESLGIELFSLSVQCLKLNKKKGRMSFCATFILSSSRYTNARALPLCRFPVPIVCCMCVITVQEVGFKINQVIIALNFSAIQQTERQTWRTTHAILSGRPDRHIHYLSASKICGLTLLNCAKLANRRIFWH